MNIFDILGPVMVGPSSSHTAGAVRIGYITARLLGSRPVKAVIGLHGSFAATGKGHGTDRALIAGLLGMRPDDMRIPESFSVAEDKGLVFSFENVNIPGAHPNTAVLNVEGENGKHLCIQASSLGGGRIMIDRLGDTDVHCTGENPTLIITNQDSPGMVAEVTRILSSRHVNIATLQLYRERRGGNAVMVIETDQPVWKETVDFLKQLGGIEKVSYISGDITAVPEEVE